MKNTRSLHVRNRATLTLLAAMSGAGIAQAVTVGWVGDTNNEFTNGANWASDPALPSLTADTWQMNGIGTQGNSTLTVTGGLAFTGGKIAFGASAPAITLTGGDLTFANATGDAILVGTGATVTQTIQNNLVLGNGAGSTISLTNQSTTGGLLKVTGNITGGTGGTAGTLTFSLGSTSTNNGNYEIAGNISKGGASLINLTKLGSGTVTLTGTNSVNQLSSSQAGSTIRINGGQTDITAADSTGGWGGSSVDNTIKVSGGILNAVSANSIRTRLVVDGGTVNISSAGATTAKLSWVSNANLTGEVFTLSSGQVNFLATGSGVAGVSLNSNAGGTISGNQTGGTFTIYGGNGGGRNLSIASGTSTNATYNLSGGTMDIRGNSSLIGQVTLTGSATNSATFSLSGTGKLISRTNPASFATVGGIYGSAANSLQVLDLSGGTLVAGIIRTSNLRASISDAAGTIINRGTNFAPGDADTNIIGKTVVDGNFSQESGKLTFDLSGTGASSVFSEAATSGKFDNILIQNTNGAGNFALTGGSIRINLVNGFESTITNANTFKIVDVTGTSTFGGSFAALSTGTITVDAYVGNTVVGTFTLDDVTNDLVLSNFTAVPEPSAFAGLAGLAAIGAVGLRRRRRD